MFHVVMVPVIVVVAIIAAVGQGNAAMVGLALAVGFFGLVVAALSQAVFGRK